MTVSSEQYQAILARLNRLEESFNDLAVALQRCVTANQVQEIFVLAQTEMADVRAIVDSLSERVTSIEEEPTNV